MKNLRPAFLLLSVTVTAMIVILLTRGQGPEGDGTVWEPGAPSEATQVAMSGAADGLEELPTLKLPVVGRVSAERVEPT